MVIAAVYRGLIRMAALATVYTHYIFMKKKKTGIPFKRRNERKNIYEKL